MTREDAKRILQDADAHLSLARSALQHILDEGASSIHRRGTSHRDFMLANDTAIAIERQRTRLARRVSGSK